MIDTAIAATGTGVLEGLSMSSLSMAPNALAGVGLQLGASADLDA
ncbi:hypothetical protein [Arthrobacter alpinus]|nr:hypothetical protein [Arthrobacter alpinus]